jgi:group I intron endonuclease
MPFSPACFVYKITNNINEKVYIGLSKNPKQRFYGHARGKTYLGRSIKKHGIENFSFDVFVSCFSLEEAKRIERFYISLYESNNQDKGYNIMGGGEGGHPHSEISNLKNRLAHLGKKMGKDFSRKISNVVSGSNNPRYVNLNEQIIDRIFNLRNSISAKRVNDSRKIGHVTIRREVLKKFGLKISKDKINSILGIKPIGTKRSGNYKRLVLNDEIISFIKELRSSKRNDFLQFENQKYKNNKMGCDKIATIINEEFNMKISAQVVKRALGISKFKKDKVEAL